MENRKTPILRYKREKDDTFCSKARVTIKKARKRHVLEGNYGVLLDKLYSLDEKAYDRVFSRKNFEYQGSKNYVLSPKKLRIVFLEEWNKLSLEDKRELNLEIEDIMSYSAFGTLTRLNQVLSFKARRSKNNGSSSPDSEGDNNSDQDTRSDEDDEFVEGEPPNDNNEEKERESRLDGLECKVRYVDRTMILREFVFSGVPKLEQLLDSIEKTEISTLESERNEKEGSNVRMLREQNALGLFHPPFRVLKLTWSPLENDFVEKEKLGTTTKEKENRVPWIMIRERLPFFFENKRMGFDLFEEEEEEKDERSFGSRTLDRQKDLTRAFETAYKLKREGERKRNENEEGDTRNVAIKVEALIQYEIPIYERIHRSVVRSYYFTQGDKSMSMEDFRCMTFCVLRRKFPNTIKNEEGEGIDSESDIFYQVDKTSSVVTPSYKLGLWMLRQFNHEYIDFDAEDYQYYNPKIEFSKEELFLRDDFYHPIYKNRDGLACWRYFYVNCHSNLKDMESLRRKKSMLETPEESLDERDIELLYGSKERFFESSYLLSRWFYRVLPSMYGFGFDISQMRKHQKKEGSYRDIRSDTENESESEWELTGLVEPVSMVNYWYRSYATYWKSFEAIARGEKVEPGILKSINIISNEFDAIDPCLPVGAVLFEGQGACLERTTENYECDFYHMLLDELSRDNSSFDLVGNNKTLSKERLIGRTIERNRITSTTWNYNKAITKFANDKLLLVLTIASDDIKGYPRDPFNDYDVENEITLVDGLILTIDSIEEHVKVFHARDLESSKNIWTSRSYSDQGERTIDYVVRVSVTKKKWGGGASKNDGLSNYREYYLPKSLNNAISTQNERRQNSSLFDVMDLEKKTEEEKNDDDDEISIFRTHKNVRFSTQIGLEIYFYGLQNIQPKPNLILRWFLSDVNSLFWGFRFKDMKQRFLDSKMSDEMRSNDVLFRGENGEKIENDLDFEEYFFKNQRQTLYYKWST